MSLRLVAKFGVVEEVRTTEVGLRRFGVPPGGPFDADSYRLATALVGAKGSVFELGMAHAEFVAESDGAVAIVGAPTGIWVGRRRFDSNGVVSVVSGDRINVEPPKMFARVYVAFGHGRPLTLAEMPPSLEAGPIPVVDGPQKDLLKGTLVESHGTVSHRSDRVGVRLDGFDERHSIELPSEPQCPGAIQVTRDGTLIIIGPDGPTIGGYPKIGVVGSSAMSRIGQLRPGDSVEFREVSVPEARGMLTRSEKAMKDRLTTLRLLRGLG